MWYSFTQLIFHDGPDTFEQIDTRDTHCKYYKTEVLLSSGLKILQKYFLLCKFVRQITPPDP